MSTPERDEIRGLRTASYFSREGYLWKMRKYEIDRSVKVPGELSIYDDCNRAT